MSAGNSSFSEILPNLQIAFDSTSLGALKECPRKYQLSIVRGKASRAQSVHLTFGLHYHSSLEAYDHAKARGESHDSALLAATERALCVTWDRDRGRPWTSDDPNKNRFTLVRSVVWYLEQFADDPLQTVILSNGKPAVELSFRLQTEILAGTGEAFWLCGHLDRVAEMGGETYIVDRKTSKSPIDENFFSKFTPDNQMSTYAFAGQVVYNLPIKGIIVDGAQIAVTFSRFMRGAIQRTDGQLAEWFQGVAVLLRQAEEYARNSFWPQNEKSCGNYGGCEFRQICSNPPESAGATTSESSPMRFAWNSTGSAARKAFPSCA